MLTGRCHWFELIIASRFSPQRDSGNFVGSDRRCCQQERKTAVVSSQNRYGQFAGLIN